MSEPITPPEPIAPPEKITFTEAQQARVNEIIKDSMARAGSEARTETERLRVELDTARKGATGDDSLVALATARAELTSLRAEQAESSVQSVLRTAVGGNQFLDAELAAQILRSSVKMVAGKPTVVDSEGNPRLNAAFNPMSCAELAQELATNKPFLARGTTAGGSGSMPSQGVRSTAIPLETLFGRTSDGPTAHRLSMTNPREYARLRGIARSKGLIP